MKKSYLKNFLFFIIGGVVCSAISVYAYSFLASDVSYTPKNENFNVDNVYSALNSLYDKSDDIYGRIDWAHHNVAKYDQFDGNNKNYSMNLSKGNYIIFYTFNVSYIENFDKNLHKEEDVQSLWEEWWPTVLQATDASCEPISSKKYSQNGTGINGKWGNLETTNAIIKCSLPNGGVITRNMETNNATWNVFTTSFDVVKID